MTSKKPKTQVEISAAYSEQQYLNYYLDNLVGSNDSILKGVGGNYSVYDDILRDDQVKAALSQRRLAVVSKEWVVEPGGPSDADKSAADFLRENLIHVGFDDITDKMLYAIFYGFAVCELIWDIKDGKYIIDKIKVRDRSRFKFTTDNSLKLKNKFSQELIDCEPPYFWHVSTGTTHSDEPYGLGLAHYLYWPVLFKKSGVKFWMKFIERFAQPSIIGKFDPGSTQEKVDKLLEVVQLVASETGVVLPKDMDIAFLESSRSSHSDYSELNKVMNEAISKIILGQTMTIEDGSSLSQSEVHMDVLQFIIEADDRMICESFCRGPARWLTEINFHGAKTPVVRRKVEPQEDDSKRAERDLNLCKMGAQPTQEYFDENYGHGWVVKREGGNISGGENSFMAFAESAFPDQTQLDDALDAITDDELNEQMTPIIEPILNFAQKHGAEKTLAKMDELYSTMDIDELTDQLAQMLFVAENLGFSYGDK